MYPYILHGTWAGTSICEVPSMDTSSSNRGPQTRLPWYSPVAEVFGIIQSTTLLPAEVTHLYTRVDAENPTVDCLPLASESQQSPRLSRKHPPAKDEVIEIKRCAKVATSPRETGGRFGGPWTLFGANSVVRQRGLQQERTPGGRSLFPSSLDNHAGSLVLLLSYSLLPEVDCCYSGSSLLWRSLILVPLSNFWATSYSCPLCSGPSPVAVRLAPAASVPSPAPGSTLIWSPPHPRCLLPLLKLTSLRPRPAFLTVPSVRRNKGSTPRGQATPQSRRPLRIQSSRPSPVPDLLPSKRRPNPSDRVALVVERKLQPAGPTSKPGGLSRHSPNPERVKQATDDDACDCLDFLISLSPFPCVYASHQALTTCESSPTRPLLQHHRIRTRLDSRN